MKMRVSADLHVRDRIHRCITDSLMYVTAYQLNKSTSFFLGFWGGNRPSNLKCFSAFTRSLYPLNKYICFF